MNPSRAIHTEVRRPCRFIGWTELEVHHVTEDGRDDRSEFGSAMALGTASSSHLTFGGLVNSSGPFLTVSLVVIDFDV